MNKLTLILVGLIFSNVCFSQTGKIVGWVYDRNEKNKLGGASVSLYESIYLLEKRIKIRALTDGEGFFQFDNITPGIYSIDAITLGHGDTTISNININAGEVDTIKINLRYCEYATIGHDRTCPVCHQSDMTVPIIYGKPTPKLERQEKRGEIFLGGIRTHCDPVMYCKRDKYKF